MHNAGSICTLHVRAGIMGINRSDFSARNQHVAHNCDSSNNFLRMRAVPLARISTYLRSSLPESLGKLQSLRFTLNTARS